MKCALEMHIYMDNLNEVYFILTTKIDRCDHSNWSGRSIASRFGGGGSRGNSGHSHSAGAGDDNGKSGMRVWRLCLGEH